MNKSELIAIDIDDTITLTAHQTFKLAYQVFGHSLSVKELQYQYGQPGEVPEWKTAEATQWFENHLGRAEYLEKIDPYPQSKEFVSEIAKQYTVACYITSREHRMREMTESWLKKHGFPMAPLFTRDYSVREKHWKLEQLQHDFSEPVSLIDDSLGALPESTLQGYRGKLIWFNPLRQIPQNRVVIDCSTWENVLKNIAYTS